MEATFQSYLTEAVYAMEREKRSQRPISETKEAEVAASESKSTSNINHSLNISYIDADSEDEKHNEAETHAGSEAVQQPPVVKMREGGGRKRGVPRPSGLNMKADPPSPAVFKRNMKFFMSVNKKRRSPPVFYLQRSQSTKEMGSTKMASNRGLPEAVPTQKSIFRTFALKRTRTWGSLVAHLNRSFRGASPSKQAFSNAWRRSQSCRNLERLFNSRR